MGYSHYWQKAEDYKGELPRLSLRHAIRVIARIVSDNKDRLANGMGDEGSEPDIRVDSFYPLVEDKNTGALVRVATTEEVCAHEEYVVFNGIEEEGLETFALSSEWDGKFEFCKTARKNYDDVVTAAIIVLQYFMGPSVRVSTDGVDKHQNYIDMEQLGPGIALALKYLPPIVPERDLIGEPLKAVEAAQ